MLFQKNNPKKAFRSFEFLIEYGFSFKKFLRPPDEEHVYSRNNIVIEADYYLGVSPSGKSEMYVDVILTVDGYRENLLKSTRIFSPELLEVLKSRLDALPPLEQIPVYAEFIKTNINTLL